MQFCAVLIEIYTMQSSEQIFIQEIRENIPYNANIVPSSWGAFVQRPLDQNRGDASHPSPCGYAQYSGSSLGEVGIT